MGRPRLPRSAIYKVHSNIPVLVKDDKVIVDNEIKVEIFNKYFCSVYNLDDGNPPPIRREFTHTIFLDDMLFSDDIVFEHLRKLKNSTSVGPDGFPSILFKSLAFELAYPLSLIFNLSLQSCQLPKIWKLANIVPIHKNKSLSDYRNYRPISLTCVPCKVMEGIVKDKITRFVVQNEILTDKQHGFRSKRSTISQLILALNEWVTDLDKNNCIDVAYLDFSKAFDTVSHSKLLCILERMNIKGNIHGWIKSFLSDRFQQVKIENALSSQMPVISGVPQGSVLGPLLYILYINDLPNVIQHSSIYIFADDTKLSFSFPRNLPSYCNLEADLLSISKWANEMQLTLALNKCSILHLGNSNPQNDYVIDGLCLKKSNLTKDLGVTVDSKLNFSSHIVDIVKKSAIRMNCLFRAFETDDVDFLMKMFNVFIRPKLEYASVVFSPHFKKDSQLIESIQRQFTRRIPCVKRKNLSYQDRLNYLAQESLELRRRKADLIMVYKIIHGLIDIDFNQLFCFNSSSNRSMYNVYLLVLIHLRVGFHNTEL